jgi:glycosyltransferase involved in cell wall biosynthesis
MKLLIVTETASMHAARWVNQLKDTGWDVHVFQAMASGIAVSEEFRFGNLHVPVLAKLSGEAKCFPTLRPERYQWLIEQNSKLPGLIQYLHENYLIKLLNEWQPDLIHSLGLNISWNNICLPVLRVLNSPELIKKPTWLYSTWGTDLDFFAKMSKENYDDVVAVLKNIDFLITECERDFRLSKEMGFNGTFLGYFTGFGGVSADLLAKFDKATKPSTRKTILLKGRSIEDGDPVGRAMTAIKAFKLCEDLLKDFRVIIGSATSAINMNSEVELLKATTDLNIHVLSHLPYDMLMDIYASARVYISLTVNDGIPSSVLEAMSSGAFPIHSDLEPIREIITDAKSGLLVGPEDVDAVADALRIALTNDHLVDDAEFINKMMIKNKFSEEVVKNNVVKMYANINLEQKFEQGNAINNVRHKVKDHLSLKIMNKVVGIKNKRLYEMIFCVTESNNAIRYGMLRLMLKMLLKLKHF